MSGHEIDSEAIRAELAKLSGSVGEISATLRHLERRLDEDPPRHHANTFRAIEALLAVYRELDSRPVLPQVASPDGGWAISAELARLLVEQVHLYEPKVILEFGSGTSTVVLGQIAKSLPGVRVVSIEHDSLWYADTLVALNTQGLHDVELLYAPLTPTQIQGEEFLWYDTRALAGLSDIDFVLVDGPPSHIGPEARYPAGPLLESRCKPGCVWVVDDTVRASEILMIQRWMEQMKLELLFERRWNKKGATVLRTPSETR